MKMVGIARLTGNASRLVRIFALSVLLIAVISPRAYAASATLSWGRNAERYLAGYKVHYGLAPRTYSYHLDAGNTLSRTVSNLADGKTYYFAVTAYDRFGNESVYSTEVSVTPVWSGAETITTPLAPSGPAAGSTGVAYTYTAKGAASTAGHSVQYRFSWSDGSVSEWLAPGVNTATKAWGTPGEYSLVFAEARCAQHPTVVSKASPSLKVSITGSPVETITAPLKPSGPTSGVVGTAYTYSAGGSVSSTGDPLQYRFSWSDGSVSDWLPAASASASTSWSAPGTYTLVRVQARCALHQSIVSAASQPITVTISPGVAETVSAPSAPTGPSSGTADIPYAFSSGGAASNVDHTVQHRFHWGDGTVSDWIGAGQTVTAWKTWSAPGTYLVRAEAACVTHPAISAFSAAVEVTIAEAVPVAQASHVLWTRGDTGQAILAQVDSSAPPGTVSLISSAYLHSTAGVGAPWRATSYAQVDASTGYVLWTRSDTGQAELWKIDPGVADVIPMLGSAALPSPSGAGGPWEAADYAHVDASTGYVLWTRSDTGQAELWKVDPGVGGTLTVVSSAALQPPPGAGPSWQAAGYAHVDASTGYVLWTRSDTGQAALAKIDPGVADIIPVTGSVDLSPPTADGAPWQATDYVHVDASTGYVLWTRGDTGQTELWKVDPGVDGAITVVGSADLASPAGAGGPWHATDYAR